MPPLGYTKRFTQLDSEEISPRLDKKQALGRQVNNSKRRSTRAPTRSSNHDTFVYVRVRPLLPSDSIKEKQASLLEHLVTDTEFPESHLQGKPKNQKKFNSEKDQMSSVHAINGPSPIGGFSGILGTNQNNLGVFSLTFLPHLNKIMQGGTSSFFCYGYTGSGKTYTSLGHLGEAGLYRLAAEELWVQIKELNRIRFNRTTSGADECAYLLQASVVEVYNDEVYDILGGRVKCSLRKNALGQLLIRGATQKHIFSEEEAKANGFDYTITTSKLTTFTISNLQDLDTVQEMAVKYRKTGSSTQNDSKSSRSHAIFRLDIVNQTLLQAQEDLEVAESTKPALQTAYDKKRSYRLRQRLLKIDNSIKEKRQMIDSLYKKAAEEKAPFGGRLLLVDLAGADSDDRNVGELGFTVNERKESTSINISLMALKDCIRALQPSSKSKIATGRRPSSSGTSVPYRNSSLTRLLEEVLTPRENRDNISIMVVNVSPASTLKSKTFNSLRYGELFSGWKKREVKPSQVLNHCSKFNNLRRDATLNRKNNLQVYEEDGSLLPAKNNESTAAEVASQQSSSRLSDDRREPQSSSRNLQGNRDSSIARTRSGSLNGISSIQSLNRINSNASGKSEQYPIISSPLSRQSSRSSETQSTNGQQIAVMDRAILEAQSFKTCRTRNPRSPAERRKLINNTSPSILKRPQTPPHRIKSIEFIFSPSQDERDDRPISPMNLLQEELNGNTRNAEEQSGRNSSCSMSSVSTSSGRSISMANSMELIAEARKRLDEVKKRAEERSYL